LSTTCEILRTKSELVSTDANRGKLEKLRKVLDELLRTALKRGFFGVIAIEVDINDGTIQKINERIQRSHR